MIGGGLLAAAVTTLRGVTAYLHLFISFAKGMLLVTSRIELHHQIGGAVFGSDRYKGLLGAVSICSAPKNI